MRLAVDRACEADPGPALRALRIDAVAGAQLVQQRQAETGPVGEAAAREAAAVVADGNLDLVRRRAKLDLDHAVRIVVVPVHNRVGTGLGEQQLEIVELIVGDVQISHGADQGLPADDQIRRLRGDGQCCHGRGLR